MHVLSELPPAPDWAVDADLAPRVGRFSGQLHEVRWGYYRGWLHGQVRRALIRRRWFQVVVHARGLTLVTRIQDDGTSGLARLFALDHAGGVRFERFGTGAPLRTLVAGFMAGEGADAFYRVGGADLWLTRAVGSPRWRLRGTWDAIRLDLSLDTREAPAPFLTIGAAAAPFAHRPGLTQRSVALPVSGVATVAGEPLDLSDAIAEVTYANAFLAPSTRARLLAAVGRAPDGRRVAVTLSDGDLHASCREATLVLGDTAYALPVTRADGARWTSDDAGAVDLRFTPTSGHQVTHRWRLRTADHASWDVGTVSGRLPLPDGGTLPVADLRALVETHRWGESGGR